MVRVTCIADSHFAAAYQGQQNLPGLTLKLVRGSKSASSPLPESGSNMSEVSSAARQCSPSCHTTQLIIGPAAHTSDPT